MDSFAVGDFLAEKLAEKLHLDFISVQDRVFPDGETQPCLAREVKMDNAVLVLQKKQGENINAYLIKYFLLLRKLKELSRRVIAVMPYFPYARQDAVFREGEPLSSLYIAEMIEKNADVFVTCNMHEHRKKISDLFEIPAHNISLFQDLAKQFTDFQISETTVIGPDAESRAFVEDFCRNFPAHQIILEKKRDVQTGQVEFFFDRDHDLTGQHVILVDDIVSTGRTILRAAQIAQKMGAMAISFAFVHAIFGDKTVTGLQSIQPEKIIVTNTLENAGAAVGVAAPLAEYFISHNLTEK